MLTSDNNLICSEERENVKGLFILDLTTTAVLSLLMRSQFELSAGEITKALNQRGLGCSKPHVHAILRKLEEIELVRALPVP